MPKKRNYNFKQLQGSSLSKQCSTRNGDAESKPTVNDRLSELRKLEGKDAAAKKRLLAESVNQRSVPNELQGILGVPESVSPRPKTGVRSRDRMRTPGPAPPKSWTAGSSGWTSTLALRRPRKGLKRDANGKERSRPENLFRFQRAIEKSHDDPGRAVPSLLHSALKSTAEAWDSFDEEDFPALLEVPLRLRLRLLSYISFYGSAINPHELEAILQGTEYVRHLDLAGLVGHGKMSVRKVARMLEKRDIKSLADPVDDVAESWDDEGDLDTALRPSLSFSRFSALTHLCLSHPGPGASWRDLLDMAKLIPQITHLSLAYWPRPTLTPNLATTTISSSNSPDIVAGGSHFYSSLDQDMTEPASLLRQLSAHLLCLQWIDLEGCPTWIPALTKLATKTPAPRLTLTEPPASENWGRDQHLGPSIFVSNWKDLRYIRCAQGWLPNLQGIQSMREQRGSAVDRLIIDGIVKHLEAVYDDGSNQQPSEDIYVAQKRARLWLEAEYKCTHASIQINSCRRLNGCKPVEMDFGWVQRHVSALPR